MYQRYILARKVNLDSGEWVADDVQTQGCKTRSEHDPAKIHQRCTIADVYLVKDKSNKIQQIILPVFGEGAKSMMYAFLALDPDGRTVKTCITISSGKLLFWEPEWKMKVGASNGRVKSG